MKNKNKPKTWQQQKFTNSLAIFVQQIAEMRRNLGTRIPDRKK